VCLEGAVALRNIAVKGDDDDTKGYLVVNDGRVKSLHGGIDGQGEVGMDTNFR